jgi:hypothetical protein
VFYLNDNVEYIDTQSGFRFEKIDNMYTLIAYIGTDDTVTLPLDINGYNYDIYRFRGAKNVIVPYGITSISDYAFYCADDLYSIVLPVGLLRIGECSFWGTNLSEIIIPDSVIIIAPNAFTDSSLTYVKLGKDLEVIGHASFMSTNLIDIEIPDNVISICNQAFQRCNNLTNVYIGKGVSDFSGAFSSCPNLVNIEISEDNPNFTSYDGVIYNSDMSRIIYVPAARTILNIPNSVITIEGRICYGNENLEYVYLADGVKSIGSEAFSGCLNLKSVNLPESLEAIYWGAFTNCKSMTSIVIPKNMNWIGDGAFSGCYNLISIEVDKGNTVFYSENNCIIERASYKLVVGVGQIPDGVKSIGYGAYVRADIDNLVIPEGVEYIDDFAFSSTEIKTLTLPSTLKSISNSAFNRSTIVIYNNSSLNIQLGSTDYNYLAYDAIMLVDAEGNKVYKNDVLETIDGFVFIIENDSYVLRAYIGDKETVLLPDKINDSDYTLYCVSGIKNVIIPDGWMSVNNMAFWGCYTLESVKIPSSVVSIGYGAFAYCKNLTSIELPDSICYLNDMSFYCSGLKRVKMSKNISFITSYLFYGTPYYDNLKWENGCLYSENILFEVDTNLSYVKIPSDTIVASGALDNCYALKEIILGGNINLSLSILTNLETIIFEETPRWNLSAYFGGTSNIPITFKNIVFKNACDITSANMFYGITGVTIYVEANKIDCSWDDDFEGWNNGNRVYYGGEWIEATFKNNGEILSNQYYATSKIIQQPYVYDYIEGKYLYKFAGFDTNGDGNVDFIPATSSSNITAIAVYKQELRCVSEGHSWNDGEVTKEPTCEETGVKTYTCTECEEAKTETIAALGHEYSTEYTVDKEATCMEAGSKSRHCVRCDSKTDVTEIEKVAHTIVTDNAVAATCTTTGLTEGSRCSVCNETITAQSVISAIGHSYGDWKQTKAPTCTEKGEQQRVCGNDSTHVETQEVAALGHTSVTDKAVAATCTTTGLTEGSHCSVCGEVITVQQTVAKTAHTSSDWIVDKAATDSEEGRRHKECTKCGEVLQEEIVPKTGVKVSVGCFGMLEGKESVIAILILLGVAVIFLKKYKK